MRSALAVAIVLAVGSALLSAATYEHKEGGLSVWFPDNWKVNIEEGSLSASSLDDLVSVELISLGAASESWRARLAAKVRQFEENEPRRDVNLNGMSGFAFSGQGVTGGVKKSVRVVVLKAPKQYVMLLWSADRATSNRFNATYDRIAGSMKPAR